MRNIEQLLIESGGIAKLVIAGEEFTVVLGNIKIKPKTETLQNLNGEIERKNYVCKKFNGWIFDE